ncbi:MAG: 50S ribosomal protein L9 [Acidobacteria bacterium]|nr:50S ribosomal protein L9 [Solirubrobacteraceae bacterium]MBU6338067.1 50S ribosomal protein L9 [Acidobacteriota bacterium]
MPQAVLTADVENLGTRGSVVNVSKGYLRNYLIPRGLAQPATKGLIAEAQNIAAAAQAAQEEAAGQARELAELLANTTLTIPAQAGEDGRLYGSVTNQDIAEAITEARGVEVDRRRIELAEPIRETGSYEVEVGLEGGVKATVKTIVVEQ